MKNKIVLICCGILLVAMVVAYIVYVPYGMDLYDSRFEVIAVGDSLSHVVEIMGTPTRTQGPGENVGPSFMNDGTSKRLLYLAPGIPIDWTGWLIDFDSTGKVISKGKLVFP